MWKRITPAHQERQLEKKTVRVCSLRLMVWETGSVLSVCLVSVSWIFEYFATNSMVLSSMDARGAISTIAWTPELRTDALTSNSEHQAFN